MVKCVILQPSYIPWRGYFHQIQKTDIFMFYDDVQYDDHGWRNRNRVKTSGGTRWLTIPVTSGAAKIVETPIRDIRITWDRPWTKKHWETLRQSYARAPYFDRYAPLLQDHFRRQTPLLADFTIDLTVALAGELGVGDRRFVRSSTLRVAGSKTDRLLALLAAVGADHYISGPSARDYIDQGQLDRAGVSVEYMVYDYPPYEQLHGTYDPQVSILDLLFMKGPEAPGYIWGSAAAADAFGAGSPPRVP